MAIHCIYQHKTETLYAYDYPCGFKLMKGKTDKNGVTRVTETFITWDEAKDLSSWIQSEVERREKDA